MNNDKNKHYRYKKLNAQKYPSKAQISFEKKKEQHTDNLDKQLLKLNLDQMKNEENDTEQELKVFEKNLKHYKIFFSSNYFPAIKLEMVTMDMHEKS